MLGGVDRAALFIIIGTAGLVSPLQEGFHRVYEWFRAFLVRDVTATLKHP
jgi:hypothetical protein